MNLCSSHFLRLCSLSGQQKLNIAIIQGTCSGCGKFCIPLLISSLVISWPVKRFQSLWVCHGEILFVYNLLLKNKFHQNHICHFQNVVSVSCLHLSKIGKISLSTAVYLIHNTSLVFLVTFGF